MCKLAAEMIGIGSLAADLGHDLKVTMYADSSAAIAISKRRGSGKLRHINIGLLWIQEKVESEEVLVKKVKGVSNPADMMTKGVNREKLEKYMVMVRQKELQGRAKEGLQLKKDTSLRDNTMKDTEKKKCIPKAVEHQAKGSMTGEATEAGRSREVWGERQKANQHMEQIKMIKPKRQSRHRSKELLVEGGVKGKGSLSRRFSDPIR